MPDHTSGGPQPPLDTNWTDDPIVRDETWAKKVHIDKLRACLNDLNGHYHVFDGNNSGGEVPDVSISWTDDPIVKDQTFVKAQHWNELMDYLGEFEGHHHVANFPGTDTPTANSDNYSAGISWSQNPVTTDVDQVQKDVIDELRMYLEDYEVHTHIACCDCECVCTCTCEGFCGEDCEAICWLWD